jgi:hypothetical protein
MAGSLSQQKEKAETVTSGRPRKSPRNCRDELRATGACHIHRVAADAAPVAPITTRRWSAVTRNNSSDPSAVIAGIGRW